MDTLGSPNNFCPQFECAVRFNRQLDKMPVVVCRFIVCADSGDVKIMIFFCCCRLFVGHEYETCTTARGTILLSKLQSCYSFTSNRPDRVCRVLISDLLIKLYEVVKKVQLKIQWKEWGINYRLQNTQCEILPTIPRNINCSVNFSMRWQPCYYSKAFYKC